MNFLKHLFETVLFTSSLPNTSIQRSWTLERGVKEPIIQIPWNFWVPYTVQFIGLFGYIWLLYKFVSSAILASISSVRKNVLEKVMRSTDLQNLFWQFLIFLESEGRFQRLCPPPTLLSFAEWVSAFSRCFSCFTGCKLSAWNCRRSGNSDVFYCHL